MRITSHVHPLLRGWLLSFLVWGLLAFVFAWQVVRVTSLPWSFIAPRTIRDWLPWAIMTPLIFRLALRMPIDRERWKLAVPIQIAGCIAMVVLCRWWGEVVAPFPSFRPSSVAASDRSEDHRRRGGADHSRGESTDGSRSSRSRGPSDGSRSSSDGPRSASSGSRSSSDSSRSSSGRSRRGPPWGPFGILGLSGLHVPIYLALVSLAHALHFYRRAQERERRSLELSASLARARLEALKMQLQPHFLFNSLNAIAALVHKDANAADEMLGALSDLLRLTLESSGEQELPLRRELEVVERYLAIEKVRFGDRLNFAIDAAPETLPALVPALVLQPLVENAVRHGLEPLRRPGELTIRAERDGAVLRLLVTDNGAGLRAPSTPREGVGLANTRARLRELYGDAAALDLISSEEGLTVRIAIPFHTNA